jgi:hypothetical protein
MGFDLNAARDETANDKRVPFDFDFDGTNYTLPIEVDVRIFARAPETSLAELFRQLLGEEQWQKIDASPSMLTNDMLVKLFDSYTRHQTGATVGESAASANSLKSTARPSKRTSNGSTKSTSARSAKR